MNSLAGFVGFSDPGPSQILNYTTPKKFRANSNKNLKTSSRK